VQNKFIYLLIKTNEIMKLEKYLVDKNGKPSSKRLMSYRLLVFFMLFNLIMFPLCVYMKVDINIVLALSAFDFMLLIAVFAPTQLSKIQEVKEAIHTNPNPKILTGENDAPDPGDLNGG